MSTGLITGSWLVACFGMDGCLSDWKPIERLDRGMEVTWSPSEIRGGLVDSYGLAMGVAETGYPILRPIDCPVFVARGSASITLTLNIYLE